VGLTSIVVVSFDSGPFLLRGVRAALASDAPVEVIVVDNASGDDSLALLSSAHGEEARLRIVRNATNTGFARACNQGLSLASGEWLLLLNPDARLTPDAVRGLVRALEAHPEAALAGPLLLNPDGSEQAGGRRDRPTPARAWGRALALPSRLRRILRAGDFVRAGDPLPSGPVEVEALSGACLLVRRGAFEAVGPLDEGYFLHCEDLDWCERFRRAGWKALFVSGVRVIHDKGVSSRGRPVRVLWHKHRGMLRYYRKFLREEHPRPLAWVVTAAVWLRFALLATVALARRGLDRVSGH
jgi:GT2 family glycosyltransferase